LKIWVPRAPRIVVYRSCHQLWPRHKSLGIACSIEGESPVLWLGVRSVRCAFEESSCLGLLLKMGGKFHLKLHIRARPLATQYREGKIKRTLKRQLNSA